MAVLCEEPKDGRVAEPRFASGTGGAVHVFLLGGASYTHTATIATSATIAQQPSRGIT